MNRKILISIIAIVAVVVVAAAVLASGVLNPPADNNVVKYVNIAPKDQAAAIQQGTVDGGVSWEPYVSDSVIAGTGHSVLDSGDYWPNHPCCVIAMDKDWAAANPDVAARFLKAHIEATEWIVQTLEEPGSENYTLLMQLGATFSNRDAAVVENATQHMGMVYGIDDQSREYFKNYTQAYMDLGLVTESKLSDNGYSSIDDFVSKYVNTAYLDAAADVQPTTEMTTVRIGYLAGDLHQFARVVASSNEVFADDDPYAGMSMFEKYGINVQTPQPGGYAAGGNVMDAFNLDQIDVGYLGSPPAIMRHLQNGIPTEIVALVNTEGSAIIVKDGINSIADLGGKTIASPGESSIQYLLLRSVADEYGLKVQMG